MLRDDGVNHSHPYQFQSVAKFKFVFIALCIIFIVIIGINKENHIFAGLGVADLDKKGDRYKRQNLIFKAGFITICVIFFLDFCSIITGLTYKSNKINALNLMFKFFITLLMFYYWIDEWQALSLVYILIFEIISFILEISALLRAIFVEDIKYDRIRLKKVKQKNKEKTE